MVQGEWSEADCCAEALKNLKGSDVARVVCCNGVQIPCEWWDDKRSPDTPEDEKEGTKESREEGHDKVKECLKLHERGHIDHGDSEDCADKPNGHITDWNDKLKKVDTDSAQKEKQKRKGRAKAEFKQYGGEIDCLKKQQQKCKGATEEEKKGCNKVIEKRKDAMRTLKKAQQTAMRTG